MRHCRSETGVSERGRVEADSFALGRPVLLLCGNGLAAEHYTDPQCTSRATNKGKEHRAKYEVRRRDKRGVRVAWFWVGAGWTGPITLYYTTTLTSALRATPSSASASRSQVPVPGPVPVLLSNPPILQPRFHPPSAQPTSRETNLPFYPPPAQFLPTTTSPMILEPRHF